MGTQHFQRAALALIGLILGACMQAGPGACSDEERAVFDSIQHFEGMTLVAEDHSTGGCAARFETSDPQAVIDHYELELNSNRWVIGPPGTQPGAGPVEMPPGVLQAHRGEMSFTVEIPMEGGDAGTVTVIVGEGP